MTAPNDLLRRGDVLAMLQVDGHPDVDGFRCVCPLCKARRNVESLPADPVAEADDDVVMRADVFAALDKRMEREEYGHAKAAVALDIEAVGRIPKRKVRVDPVAKAERRVAQAMLAWHGTDRLSVSSEAYRAIEAEGAAAIEELRAAVAARSAGLSDGGKDRKATGELSVAQKPAPAPDAPCDFCLGRREVQKMGLCPQCRGSST